MIYFQTYCCTLRSVIFQNETHFKQKYYNYSFSHNLTNNFLPFLPRVKPLILETQH